MSSSDATSLQISASSDDAASTDINMSAPAAEGSGDANRGSSNRVASREVTVRSSHISLPPRENFNSRSPSPSGSAKVVQGGNTGGSPAAARARALEKNLEKEEAQSRQLRHRLTNEGLLAEDQRRQISLLESQGAHLAHESRVLHEQATHRTNYLRKELGQASGYVKEAEKTTRHYQEEAFQHHRDAVDRADQCTRLGHEAWRRLTNASEQETMTRAELESTVYTLQESRSREVVRQEEVQVSTVSFHREYAAAGNARAELNISKLMITNLEEQALSLTREYGKVETHAMELHSELCSVNASAHKAQAEMALQYSGLEESNAQQIGIMNSQVQNLTDSIVLERKAIETSVYTEFEKVTTANRDQVAGLEGQLQTVTAELNDTHKELHYATNYNATRREETVSLEDFERFRDEMTKRIGLALDANKDIQYLCQEKDAKAEELANEIKS